MGDQKVRLHRSTKQKLKFIEVLLKDIEALETMFKEGLFENTRLVGIVTEHDFVDIAGQLLKELQAKGGE